MNHKQKASLKAAINFRLDNADHAAAIAANKASGTVVEANAIYNTGSIWDYANAIATVGDDLVDQLKNLYTLERSKMIWNEVDLKTDILQAIIRYFELSERFCPTTISGMLKRSVYIDLLNEHKERDLAAIKDHFRRPGLKPLWERFPFLFGGVTVGSVIAAIIVGVLVKSLTT